MRYISSFLKHVFKHSRKFNLVCLLLQRLVIEDHGPTFLNLTKIFELTRLIFVTFNITRIVIFLTIIGMVNMTERLQHHWDENISKRPSIDLQ